MLHALMRAVLLLVPARWRDSVARDLAEEAAYRKAGPAWRIWHAASIGIVLRVRGALVERRGREINRRSAMAFDLRMSLRALGRDRRATAAIVGTLALGIGAATATHAVFNVALFSPVPGVDDGGAFLSVYFQPDRAIPDRAAVSHGHLVALRENVNGLEGLASHSATEFPLRARADSPAEMRRVTIVTLGYFELLGVTAIRGRMFAHDEYERSARQVAVISERFWKTELAGLDSPVGHIISIAGQPFEVIGVVDDYRGLDRFLHEDVWIPFAVRDRIGRVVSARPDYPWHFRLVGKLRPGATTEQVQAQADAVYEGVGDMPGRTERFGPTVFSGITDGIGQTQGRLLRVYWLLLSAVALLLLLACANAANLMLGRNVRRLPSLAVRSAIGASRWRLLRELLVEMALGAPRSSISAGVLSRAAVTTGIGLGAGLALYAWSSRFLESRVFEVTARDPMTVTAVCALLMMAALAAAWMPARRAMATDPTTALRSE